MAKNNLPPIAIIADAHFHDTQSHYDFDGIIIEGQRLTLRSWADTRRSSRVFNESKVALNTALQDIEARGIKHVVLLGDYTDDGQNEAYERLIKLLRAHRDHYGTHFFAITGNHDAYGPMGKHQSTRFVSGIGTTTLVTSDPEVAATETESAICTLRMFCEGVPDGVTKMSEFGLFRQTDYLHWETPFGGDDSIDSRRYDAQSADGLQLHKLVDASYLVEPADGLWLLMIDANVFEPRVGNRKPAQKKAFLDSSDAGWNSVLRNRPYLIDWISDVCSRAEHENKTLIAFSHYPIIDPFADTDNNALKLFGNTEMIRRKPGENVSTTLLDCRLRLHFSGHLHVNALSQRANNTSQIEDSAVPSLVAFPACYKIVHTSTSSLNIDTVNLNSMPLDTTLLQLYREENKTISDHECTALNTSNYGEFLYQRMHTRTVHHYLVKEWPKEIAESVLHSTAADLACLMMVGTEDAQHSSLTNSASKISPDQLNQIAQKMTSYQLSLDDLAACSMTQLVSDWYCLRHARYVARDFIRPEKINLYCFLADTFGDCALVNIDTPRSFFSVFLGLLELSITRSEKTATRERVVPANCAMQDVKFT